MKKTITEQEKKEIIQRRLKEFLNLPLEEKLKIGNDASHDNDPLFLLLMDMDGLGYAYDDVDVNDDVDVCKI